MRRITPQVVEKERDGSFDKQVVYITFRESYINEFGILECANGLKRGLNKKGVKPSEFVQINAQKIGIVVTSITDMMEIKEFGKTRKSVLILKSGEERIIGAHVSQEEKDKYYDQIRGKATKKNTSTESKDDEKKEDL